MNIVKREIPEVIRKRFRGKRVGQGRPFATVAKACRPRPGPCAFRTDLEHTKIVEAGDGPPTLAD